MSADGIVLASLVAALLGALAWHGWRAFTPRWKKTPAQLAAEAEQATKDTFYLNVADHVITATGKTGRSSWL